MKRILVFTGWYPHPEEPYHTPFVRAQMRMLYDYGKNRTAGDFKMCIWHERIATDLPNMILRGESRNRSIRQDGELPVFTHRAAILAHRLPVDQTFLIRRSMGATYRDILEELQGEPELVLCVTLSAALLWESFAESQGLRIPCVLQEHSRPLSMHLRKASSVRRAIRLATSLKAVVVVAHRQVEEFSALSREYRPVVIPNPVTAEFVERPVTSGDRNFDFIFVGRFSEEKGWARLIRALTLLKIDGVPMKTVLVGDGDDREPLEKMIAKFGLSDDITLTGLLEPCAIIQYMDRSKIFVLPSIIENSPVALAEAQVRGLPCIVTVNGGSEFSLLDGNGMAVNDSGEGNELATAMASMRERYMVYDRKSIRERSLAVYAPEQFAEAFFKTLESFN